MRVRIFIYLFSFLIFFSCIPSDKKTTARQDSVFTTEDLLVNGQKQYHLRGCIKCHGRTGEGNGYRVLGLPPSQTPRNFKDLSSYNQGSDHKSIAFTIRNGITNRPPVTRRGFMDMFSDNKKPSSGMPAYPHLTDEEINHIATYILYLQTNQKP